MSGEAHEHGLGRIAVEAAEKFKRLTYDLFSGAWYGMTWADMG